MTVHKCAHRYVLISAEADVGPAALTMHMAVQTTRFGSSMDSQANDHFSVQITSGGYACALPLQLDHAP